MPRRRHDQRGRLLAGLDRRARLIQITCGAISIDLIVANRLQLFAEAAHKHATNGPLWEFPTGIIPAQEERQQVEYIVRAHG